MPQIGRHFMPSMKSAMWDIMQTGKPPIPILHLKYGENVDDAIADSSPNGNDATKYGPTWVKGILGPGLQYDGLDDYTQVPHISALAGPSAFTLMSWFKSTDVTKQYQQIAGKQYGTSEYRLLMYANDLHGDIFSSSAKHETKSSDGSVYIEDDTYYHATMTYDGETLKLYVNAVLVDSNETEITIFPNAHDFYVGNDKAGNFPFKGIIDETIMFDSAFTLRQIQRVYQGYR